MQSGAVRTTCPYCGVGCGVLATPGVPGQPHDLKIEGDPAHPANFGRLCVKGAALGETVGLSERLLKPRIKVSSRASSPPPRPSPLKREGAFFRDAGWDDALDSVAAAFTRAVERHGPESVAFYVSGQLLTEDYYVANKLMKGFIGAANIDTNSRLCMSSAVAGHRRAFGEDVVPVSYTDFDLADLVVLVGSNTAWCHPVLYQRIVKAREARPGMKVVVIDPRATATCDIADLHLPVRAGTDVWLFNGLLTFLHEHGITDAAFVERHTAGASRALAVAANSAGSVEAVARQCGVNAQKLAEFYRLFGQHQRAITVFSQGVNQSSSGTDKVNSIINCHLLTGRIGKPGAGPFSVTGQPNAMGGREVGGLSNTLAAHLEFEPAHRELVQAFWNSPRIAQRPGLKAVELFDAIHAGRVKAVWIMATNPVVSLPDADRVRDALERCEFVAVSDVTGNTDTAKLAHVLLPALGWGEKDGTVTNSDRHISRCRAFLPPPGEAKPDWWIVSEVARRMGFADAFPYAGPHEIFEEHARLSGFRNDGALSRCFDISGLAGMTREAYDRLEPVQWPVNAPPAFAGAPVRRDGRGEVPLLQGLRPGMELPQLFSDGRFCHPDGRARFVATPPRPPANAPDADFPFVLNTGRIRDQWHTMTRTGLSPRLAGHLPEPFVEIHPQDALAAGVREGRLARVATRWGAVVARARTADTVRRGTLFVPIHWSGPHASDARVGALVNPAVDPVSGEPEFKHTPARIEPFMVDWHGFALIRRRADAQPADRVPETAWWTRVTGDRFTRFEFAGRGPMADPPEWLRTLLAGTGADSDWLEYRDAGTGVYRAAAVSGDRIESCAFVSPRIDLPSRAWLGRLFALERLEETDRASLLAGEPFDRGADTGPPVCSCFGVGRNTIVAAIGAHRLQTVEAIGEKLKAGTNCGSCVPELRGLLREVSLDTRPAGATRDERPTTPRAVLPE